METPNVVPDWLLTECWTDAMKYDSDPITFSSSRPTYAAIFIRAHAHARTHTHT